MYHDEVRVSFHLILNVFTRYWKKDSCKIVKKKVFRNRGTTEINGHF